MKANIDACFKVWNSLEILLFYYSSERIQLPCNRIDILRYWLIQLGVQSKKFIPTIMHLNICKFTFFVQARTCITHWIQNQMKSPDQVFWFLQIELFFSKFDIACTSNTNTSFKIRNSVGAFERGTIQFPVLEGGIFSSWIYNRVYVPECYFIQSWHKQKRLFQQ